MQRPAFQLARRVTQVAGLNWWCGALGTVAGLLIPLLILDLGLIVQLLVTRDSRELPGDWLMESVVVGRFGSWPFFGRHEYCVLALVGGGWLISLLLAGTLMLLYRRAHGQALSVAGALRHKIYTQAFRLGPYDLLGATRTRPDELFAERVETLRRGFANWWMTIPLAAVTLVGLGLVAAIVNVWLTLLAVLLTAMVLRFYRGVRLREQGRAASGQERLAELDKVLRESLHLAPLLKGYSLIEPPMPSFESMLKSTATAAMDLARRDTLLKPLLLLVVLWAIGFLLLIIGFAPNVSVSGMVLLCAAWLAGYFPFARLVRLPAELDAMDAAASEIEFFLDREPFVVQLAEAQPLDRLSRLIVFDHVHLADRHGRRLLDDISLNIPAGQRTAILASDAQTPLALAGLLVRFYDPTAGRILFDDNDISRATLDTVRGQTALALKDGLLFPGTINQNVTCDDSGFTAVQIQDALKQASAAEFLRELPHGAATEIHERQVVLRPDQSFRIGLARALLRAPSLLVIQEPDDPGDDAVSHELEQALLQAGDARTLIILPSRISTLRTSDSIYIFHEGKFHGNGKHAELLQSSELYRHLCYVRFNPYRKRTDS